MNLEIYFPSSLWALKKKFAFYLHLWFLRLLLYIVILKKFHFLRSNCLEHRQKRRGRASALQWDSCSLTEGNQQSLTERQGNTILLKSRGDAASCSYFLCCKAQRKIYIYFPIFSPMCFLASNKIQYRKNHIIRESRVMCYVTVWYQDSSKELWCTPKLHKWPHKLMKANFSLRCRRIVYTRTLKYYELNLQKKILLEKKINTLISEILTAVLSLSLGYSGNSIQRTFFFHDSLCVTFNDFYLRKVNNILLVFHFCNCYLLIEHRKRKKWQDCMIFHIHIHNHFNYPDIFLKMGRGKREKFLPGQGDDSYDDMEWRCQWQLWSWRKDEFQFIQQKICLQ